MAYELRPGQGTAFMNKDKREEWHADFRGEILLPDGTLCYMDVRPGKTKAGDDWYSVKIGKPKMPKQTEHYAVIVNKPNEHSQAKANGYQPGSMDDLKDDIPW
jgi:hypothetical protein